MIPKKKFKYDVVSVRDGKRDQLFTLTVKWDTEENWFALSLKVLYFSDFPK